MALDVAHHPPPPPFFFPSPSLRSSAKFHPSRSTTGRDAAHPQLDAAHDLLSEYGGAAPTPPSLPRDRRAGPARARARTHRPPLRRAGALALPAWQRGTASSGDPRGGPGRFPSISGSIRVRRPSGSGQQDPPAQDELPTSDLSVPPCQACHPGLRPT